MRPGSSHLRIGLIFSALKFCLFASAALAQSFPSTYVLPRDQWQQIVIPGMPPAQLGTPAAIFGDELDVSSYGSGWVLFRFNSLAHVYERVQLTDSLIPGRAYWIIQLTPNNVVVALPDNTIDFAGGDGYGDGSVFYVRTPIADEVTNSRNRAWSMIGKPGLQITPIDDLRVLTNASGPCRASAPCTLEQSLNSNLTDYQLYAYNPSTESYDTYSGSDSLPDWQGFWLSSDTSSGVAVGREILFPVPAPPVSTFNDEFNANTLANWSRRHMVEATPAQYTTLDINQSRPGALSIVPTLTPGWYANGDAPLLFKLVSGNFSVETHVVAESRSNPGSAPASDFNSGGLMARNPAGGSGPENYVMVNVGRQNSSIPASVGSESKSTVNSNSQLDLRAGVHQGRLILCRIGTEFYTYRLLDNEATWTRIGSATRADMPTTVQVGMVANGFSGPDLRATFDYVRLRVPASEAGCTPG